MASMRLLAIIAILVQGLVNGDSHELPSFDPELAVAKVWEVAEGKVGPDVKVFNVVDFGASPMEPPLALSILLGHSKQLAITMAVQCW
ncbi:hypothetical protein ES319_1Z004300v1 [Gossypium barbadense]|uniref:Uncharacterized protein n=1 Tax=Gossypium barbadense TaxID=3634 RepID=A0A5J5NAG1_GOSBA|nr:hypothetical protein ES319_1Z004300v1 [Gossypium barbadense]